MIGCINFILKRVGQHLVVENINISAVKDMNILIKWDG